MNLFRTKQDVYKDEIDTLTSLYYEFFTDEKIGGVSKGFKTIISSDENYTKNPYYKSDSDDQKDFNILEDDATIFSKNKTPRENEETKDLAVQSSVERSVSESEDQ